MIIRSMCSWYVMIISSHHRQSITLVAVISIRRDGSLYRINIYQKFIDSCLHASSSMMESECERKRGEENKVWMYVKQIQKSKVYSETLSLVYWLLIVDYARRIHRTELYEKHIFIFFDNISFFSRLVVHSWLLFSPQSVAKCGQTSSRK